LDRWEFQETSATVDETRTRRTQTYRDLTSGLTVRCEIVQYQDYPVVEWTLYFKNAGRNDTAILENIQALDARFKGSVGNDFLLHHHVGSHCSARDYAPLETRLGPGQTKRISAAGGRPTNSDWSYFNLDGGSRGVILAVGWPGQWAAEFVRDAGGSLRVLAGQERTHFKLHPGEEIRTPLIVIQFWEGGDWTRAQNVWRRWFIAHNLRKPGGKLPPIQWCGASETGTNLMVGATEENQKTFVDAYLERGLKPDFWWMDAGWYPCQGDWTRTGTWEPDKARFPRGLRPVTDYLHARGIRAILWFEPERVTADTWLTKNHPEWILGGKDGGLLNLGHPEAWTWLVNHVDKLLTDEGIDIYRQDFNMDPLPLWRAHDAEDRQGITEIRHVTGLLAYWDELLRRHPDVLYDNCASGGRRNDLESMRRGVPYTKSDYATDLVGVQGQTYGISFWLPYFAATWDTRDSSYPCRSRMAPVVGACLDGRNRDHFRNELPRRLEEWRKIVANYWGDYWPLTPYSLDNKVWMAWQFDCPESDQGVVQAFRRAETTDESIRLRLRGLEPNGQYALTDLDSGRSQQATGRELVETGVLITATSRPSAPVMLYRKAR
jgi:alpha-galactosidase